MDWSSNIGGQVERFRAHIWETMFICTGLNSGMICTLRILHEHPLRVKVGACSRAE